MSADVGGPRTQSSAAGSLMRLLWLASPALPIGAYAYSRGLEHAVDAGWVVGEQGLTDWIGGVLENQIATLDAPILVRLMAAYLQAGDTEVRRWNDFLRAARESAETALEDRQLGLSLAKVLREAGVPRAAEASSEATYVQLFALACAHYRVATHDAVSAYMFAFAEGQITAAIKLMPLGQSAGQRVLGALMASIDAWAQQAQTLADHELGAFTPGLALASMLHETQYTRLFRS